MKNGTLDTPYIERLFSVPEVFSDYEEDNKKLRYEVSVQEPYVPGDYPPDIGYEEYFDYGEVEVATMVREWGWYTPTKEIAYGLMAELRKKGLKPEMRELKDN
jgi:hypothetical protein